MTIHTELTTRAIETHIEASSVSVNCPECNAFFNEYSTEDVDDGDATVDSNDLEDFDEDDVIRDFMQEWENRSSGEDRNIYALPASHDVLPAAEIDESSQHSATTPPLSNNDDEEFNDNVTGSYEEFYDNAEQFRTSSFELHDLVHSLVKEEAVCNEDKFLKISSELLAMFKSHQNMMDTIVDINHKLAKKNDDLKHCLKEAKMMNEKISGEVDDIKNQLHEERRNRRSILRIFRL